jgi:hypothetical protein
VPTEQEIKAVGEAYDCGFDDGRDVGLRLALREAHRALTVEDARQRIRRLLDHPDGT